jgi:hypothetical protein
MKDSTKAIIIGIAMPTVVTAGIVGYGLLVTKPKMVKKAFDLTEKKFDTTQDAPDFKAEEWRRVYKKMNFFTLRTLLSALQEMNPEVKAEFVAKLKKEERRLNKSGYTKLVEKNNGLPLDI